MPIPKLNTEIGTLYGNSVMMNRQLYDLLVGVSRNPNNKPVTPTLGASPYVYTNSTPYDADVFVTGGTVTALQLARGGAFYNTTGTVRLSPGDAVRISYTVAPTVAIIPR